MSQTTYGRGSSSHSPGSKVRVVAHLALDYLPVFLWSETWEFSCHCSATAEGFTCDDEFSS